MSDDLTKVLKQFEAQFGVKISIGDDTPSLLSNDAGVDFLQRKVGLKLPISRLDKDKMLGRMPPPDFYYGRVELRKPVTWLRYAIGLLTSERGRLPGSRSGLPDARADRGAS